MRPRWQGTGLVFARDLRELRRGRALALLIGLHLLLALGAVVASGVALTRLQRELAPLGPTASAEAIAGQATALAVGVAVFFVTMLPYLALVWTFAGALMTRERATGNLETLLATPLGLPALWLGKSLAIFLPAWLLSLACAGLAVVGIAAWASALTGQLVLVLPLPVALGALAISPLLYAWLIASTIRIAFTRSPDLAVLPSFVVGFGLMIGVPLGLGTGAIDLLSWRFAAGYGLGTLALLLTLLPLALTLSRERVVLAGGRD